MEKEYFYDKNIVKVKIYPEENDFQNELTNIKKKIGFFGEFNFEKNLKYKDVYTGIAKCHPDDTFNLEKGKSIAYEKAMHKFFVDRLKMFQMVREGYFELGNRLFEAHARTIEAAYHNNNNVISLTMGEEEIE